MRRNTIILYYFINHEFDIRFSKKKLSAVFIQYGVENMRHLLMKSRYELNELIDKYSLIIMDSDDNKTRDVDLWLQNVTG